MGIKLKRFNESIDEEDFQNIFQDLIDDFPEVKWNINKESIKSIINNKIPKVNYFRPWSGQIEGKGEPNLIGYSCPLNIGHARSDYLHKYKCLTPYFREISNRLSEHGINIGFYKRVISGGYYKEFFCFTIILKANSAPK